MDKYALLKRFNHDLQLQVYIHASMYGDPETIILEEYFLPTKKFVVNYNNMSNPGPVPKHWLGYSCTRLEDDEFVNYRVPTTVRHGSYFQRICPKPQSRPRRLPVVRHINY